MKALPNLHCTLIISLRRIHFQKAPFTEIQGWECRGRCCLLLGLEGGQQQLSPWVSLTGNGGQALALSSPWHSNPGGRKAIITHKPIFIVPILKCLGEMRLLSSVAAFFVLPSGNGPCGFCAGRIYLGYVPLKQSICNSAKAKYKYNESQQFLSIWKCLPKWLKLNFIRRNP